MKLYQKRRWFRYHQHIPTVAHISELLVGLIILAAVQNFWVALVGANPDITPPSVPANVQLTSATATEADISWDASTDDVGVTGYHVYRNGSVVGTATSSLSYMDTGLTPSTNYSYTVSAYDAASNESAQSSTLSAATLADTTPPTTPTNVHQTSQTVSSISLAWDASTDNVGVTSYQIYRNGSLVRSQPSTTYTDTGLAPYTGYSYIIVALDAANNGSNSSATFFGASAPDVTPPSVPDNLRKVSSTVSSINLAWDASTDDVGVTGYHVYRNGNLVTSVAGTSYTDTGLTVSSNYSYTVSAYDAASNDSGRSALYSASSSDDVTPPSVPVNLRTTSVLDTSISLAWDASTDDVGVTGYKIYRDSSLVGTATTTSYTDTGLTPVTQYSYTVEAYDAANNTSNASSALQTTTAFDTTAPTIPSNLQATSTTDTTISLSWTAATDNVGVTGYDIYRGNTIITTTTGTSFTDSNLSVHTGYTYRVRAHDGSGNNSNQSSPLNTTTIADLVAPSVPASLVSTNQTTTGINLMWNAATDDASPSNAITYNLYRNGIFIANQSGLTFTDTPLHYNTNFQYAVTAVDAAGNESAPSTALSVSTLPDTVAPTVQITAPTSGQSAQLTFPVSATASDDLDLNRVEFYVDSTLIDTATSAPFSFNWNSYAVHNGQHTISAKAIDASGNYTSQSVAITISNPPPPIVGDLNGDHKINIYDLSILLSHWNKPGAGDFNNNGRVDIFDLSTLLSRYGQDNSTYQ